MATALPFLHPYDIINVASKSGNCRDLSANSIKLFIEKFNDLAGAKKLHYVTASEARSEMTMAVGEVRKSERTPHFGPRIVPEFYGHPILIVGVAKRKLRSRDNVLTIE